MVYFKIGENFTTYIPVTNYPNPGESTLIKVEAKLIALKGSMSSSYDNIYFEAKIVRVLDNEFFDKRLSKNVCFDVHQSKCKKIYKAASKSYQEILNDSRIF